MIIGAETRLPYKPPKSNLASLNLIAADLQSSKFESGFVSSLKSIVIVNNAEDRVDLSELKALTAFQSVLEEGSTSGDRAPTRNLDPHDIVNIQFTSGTTSMPKAACLTHRSILNNGKSIGVCLLLLAGNVSADGSRRIVCFSHLPMSYAVLHLCSSESAPHILAVETLFYHADTAKLFWLYSWIYGYRYSWFSNSVP